MDFGKHPSENSNVGRIFLGKPFVTLKCSVFNGPNESTLSFGECVTLAYYS